MILLIVIFGTYKKHKENIVEYDQSNFKYIESLKIFEKKFDKFNNFSDEYLKITEKINLTNCLIPNIVDIFIINLKPKKIFNINKLISNIKSNVMIIYDHSNMNTNSTTNNLFLLIDQNNECNGDICGNYGYLYPITNKVSIFGIYPIFNFSDKTINFTLLIIKKSYWFF
jgi:hypothetical protein